MSRLFRFSIRELMLVTLVVGLGVGWCIEHRQAASLRQEMIMYEYSSELVGTLLDEALDELTKKRIALGEPVMIPIYSNEPAPNLRQLIYSDKDK